MAKTDKKKSLRQQMRDNADIELAAVTAAATSTVAGILADMNCGDLDPHDVMKLCSSTQTDTLRHKLIGQLADRSERDLVNIWNNQHELDLEKKDAK